MNQPLWLALHVYAYAVRTSPMIMTVDVLLAWLSIEREWVAPAVLRSQSGSENIWLAAGLGSFCGRCVSCGMKFNAI